MSTGKVFLGVLAGFAAGALVGVLFAPDKGTVTRKKIVKKGVDLAEDVSEKFDEFIENINEKLDEVKENVEKVKAKAQSAKRAAEAAAK
ncbi:MAG: YtxH domain-containing protein [Bacteroidales bacterium]|jgi:gas vesicle protein|nr:YtxH domain-containing protein [Bacteroidales bacterium]